MPGSRLSRREREVAALVAEGLTNRLIAERLFISGRTVEGHVEHALNKLGFSSRAQLAGWMAEQGGSLPVAGDARLPSPASRFIGRSAEVAAVRKLLHEHRLVTVVGPGGVGKTRLAIAVAATTVRFRRVRFVDLAPVGPGAVSDALADAMAAPNLQAALTELQTSPTLLVLDNCEHVIDSAAITADLVLRESDTTVLATSREPLSLDGERLVTLTPMDRADAVALFQDRAAGASVDAEDVVNICERVDRLPLGVELAAARSRFMGTRELAGSLGKSLSILGSGPRTAPARQRTIDASIRWSYDLLEADEQSALTSLSVFSGAFTLEAGAVLAGSETVILRLAERSLVVGERDRYRLLVPVREFAAARLLESGRTAEAERLHDEFYVDWSARYKDPLLLRRAWAPADIWAERDEIRTALPRLRHRDTDRYVTLATIFARAWREHGDIGDANALTESALSFAGDDHLMAPFLRYTAASFADALRRWEVMLEHSEIGARLAAQHGDTLVAARLHNTRAIALKNLGRTEEAIAELRTAIDDQGEALPDFSFSWHNLLGMQYLLLGRYSDAERAARQGLEIPSDATLTRAMTLATLAHSLVPQGRLDEALAAQLAAIQLLLEFGLSAHAPDALLSLARIALAAGDDEQVAALLGAARRLARELHTTVEDDIWLLPDYAAAVEHHSDVAARFDGLSWEQALRAAGEWKPPR